MTDELDPNEPYLRRRLATYVDGAIDEIVVDHREIARRAAGRSAPTFPLGLLLVGLLVVAAAALLVRAALPSTGTELGREAVASCAGGAWPATAISCDVAFGIGNQAGARLDRARIWLTTLGAVKTAMAPAQQTIEPADAATVWVIVYDGFWRCCTNAFDQNGNTLPLVVQTSWLVVAEAGREGTGFIYAQDWSGRSVPTLLAAPVAPGASATPTASGFPAILTIDSRGGLPIFVKLNGVELTRVACSAGAIVTPGDPGVPPLPWVLTVVKQSDGKVLLTGTVHELPQWVVLFGEQAEIGSTPVAGPPGPSCLSSP